MRLYSKAAFKSNKYGCFFLYFIIITKFTASLFSSSIEGFNFLCGKATLGKMFLQDNYVIDVFLNTTLTEMSNK